MLIPEVRALLNEGKLHEFDAEWIQRLKPESQLAAAMKCVNGPPVTGIAINPLRWRKPSDNPKTEFRSKNMHGSKEIR